MGKKIFSILLKIKRVISTIFFIILLLYLAIVGLQRLSGNKSILGYRVFNVASESMFPVYKINDIIAVKDYDVNNPTSIIKKSIFCVQQFSLKMEYQLFYRIVQKFLFLFCQCSLH